MRPRGPPQNDAAKNGPPCMPAYKQAALADAGRATRRRAVCNYSNQLPRSYIYVLLVLGLHYHARIVSYVNLMYFYASLVPLRGPHCKPTRNGSGLFTCVSFSCILHSTSFPLSPSRKAKTLGVRHFSFSQLFFFFDLSASPACSWWLRLSGRALVRRA